MNSVLSTPLSISRNFGNRTYQSLQQASLNNCGVTLQILKSTFGPSKISGYQLLNKYARKDRTEIQYNNCPLDGLDFKK